MNMKGIFLFMAALMLLTACEKKYKYVETVKEQSILSGSSIKDKEAVIISAASDSIAYIEAFTKYCISQKVYNKMLKEGMADYLDIPITFRLYNEDGVDITNISFATRLEEEERISASIMAMVDVVNCNPSEGAELAEVKVDSAKIEELLPFFNVTKDEFDPKGKIWYEPKSAPQYTNQNGIYLYFAVQDGKVMSLRFRVQYYADDWLFFSKIQFAIDDNAYEYIPSHTEHDNGDGGKIWEWFDEALTGSDKNLIYALTEAQSAKMKFIGRQYYDIKTITNSQVTDMKRTLELYRAMGGSY